MTRPLYALVLGLSLSFCLTASAFTVENKGTPEPNVTSMSTYGFDVATRTGLKTVVPAGWQLFVHKSVQLPPSMSWKLGESWPAVLTNFASQNNVAVLIDWNSKAVMLRSPEQAIEEKATRDEIKQAAVTPLPAFEGALTQDEYKQVMANRAAAEQRMRAEQQALADARAKQAKEEAAKAATVATAQSSTAATTVDGQAGYQAMETAPGIAQLPVIRTNPTPDMQANAAQGDSATRQLASTNEFTYSAATAVNRPSARSVAQSIANRYGLRLVFAAPEFNLKGPVTLLSDSVEQDAWLLQRAIGHQGPATVEVSTAEKVLRVVSRDGTYIPDPYGGDNRLNSSTAHVTDGLTFSASKEAAPVLVLNLVAGEPLEDALVRFTRSQGFTLEWKVSGGFEAGRAMQFSGETVTEVLNKVLPDLGLSADIYTHDKHIVVRPGDAVTDR